MINESFVKESHLQQNHLNHLNHVEKQSHALQVKNV